MHATTVAIDLAKEVFELAFADGGGRIVERKRLSRRHHHRERGPVLQAALEGTDRADAAGLLEFRLNKPFERCRGSPRPHCR